MVFRVRRRPNIWLRKGIGIILAGSGLTILAKTLPVWVWYALLGIMMTGAGWYFFVSKNFWK